MDDYVGNENEQVMSEEDSVDSVDCIARISAMEDAMVKAAVAILGLEQDLDDFEAAQDDIARLAAYYGSAEWFADRDVDEAGELPDDLARGVLGEDYPYDLLVGYHDLLVRMLEVATRGLKQEGIW